MSLGRLALPLAALALPTPAAAAPSYPPLAPVATWSSIGALSQLEAVGDSAFVAVDLPNPTTDTWEPALEYGETPGIYPGRQGLSSGSRQPPSSWAGAGLGAGSRTRTDLEVWTATGARADAGNTNLNNSRT